MPKINSRNKGASGEREFCKWLASKFPELGETPTRNLDQTRDGGTDVIVPPFCFEVKRNENLDLQAAWVQVKTDAKERLVKYGENLIPVVAFRYNRKPWEFLIPAAFVGLELGFLRLNETVFVNWANRIVANKMISDGALKDTTTALSIDGKVVGIGGQTATVKGITD